MLFDLEDYRVSGAIGVNHTTADKVFWDDHYATHRATKQAYINNINYYYLAAGVTCKASERHQLDIDYIDMMDAFVDFSQKSRIFWPALVSLPVKGDFQEGDRFSLAFVSIGDTTTGVDYHLPLESEWYYGSMKWVAVLDANGDYAYGVLTQEIYDDYKNALVLFQSKVKTLMLHGEGQSVFQELVVPEIPVWDGYPELSGYVRDNRNLTVKDAQVVLVDAAGEEHVIVTNSSGYYKFTKEFIYNNVSLGATGSTSFELQMKLLPAKTDGTVLYDAANILQNSFFGAVNDRGLTWPVSIRMGRPARKNFKIEFIPDYSAYPSLSGTILDKDGNPVANALVELQYPVINDACANYGSIEGCLDWVNIGDTYNSQTNEWKRNTKFKLFGVDKSILTDENGHYEYPSQMVGEWVNNHLKKFYSTYNQTGLEFTEMLVHNPYVAAVGFHINDSIIQSVPGWPGAAFGDYGVWKEFSNNAVAVQSDGKILVGGIFDYYNGWLGAEGSPVASSAAWSNNIIRLNVDGSLDETFNPNIYRLTPWSQNGQSAAIEAIVIEQGGTILVGGNMDHVGGTQCFGLVRLNSDGTLNTAFQFPDNHGQNAVKFIKVLSDGTIVASDTYSMYRFNADGTLYQEGSILPFESLNNYSPNAYDWTELFEIGDGSFLLYGAFGAIVDADNNILGHSILKLNSDFTIDSGFNFPQAWGNYGSAVIKSVIKEASGTYIVSGHFTTVATGNNENLEVNGIMRINANGSFNKRFEGITHPGMNGGYSYGVAQNQRIYSKLIEINGVKTLAMYGDAGLFLADYLTETPVQSGIAFDDKVQAVTTSGSDLIILGEFNGYREFSFDGGYPSNDNLSEKYSAGLGGIAKFSYGNYQFINRLYKSAHGYFFQYVNDPSNIDSRHQVRWSVNDVMARLNPWTQDPISGDVVNYSIWNYRIANASGQQLPILQAEMASRQIYDLSDWFNSRFAYAENWRGEQYSIEMYGGHSSAIDVHVTKTIPETGAEIFKIGRYPGAPFGTLVMKTTSGYATMKDPSGQYHTFGYGNPESYFNISYNFNDYDYSLPLSQRDTKMFMDIYSSEGEHGSASGKIKSIGAIGFWDGQCQITIESIKDLTEIESFSVTNGVTEVVDFTGMSSLTEVGIYNGQLHPVKVIGMKDLNNVKNLYIDGVIYSDFTRSTTDFVYEADLQYWKKWGGNDYPKLNFWGYAESVSKDSEGRYVISGSNLTNVTVQSIGGMTETFNGQDNLSFRGIIRLNADHTIDDTFSRPNFVSNFGTPAIYCNGIQSTGKILVGGAFTQVDGNSVPKGLVRLNSNGTIDNAFSSQVTIDEIYSIKVQPDDSFFIHGWIYYNGQGYGLAKINSNGSVNTLFSIADGQVNGYALLPNGKVMAESNNQLIRFNSDGTVDSTFSDTFGVAYRYSATTLKAQADGKFYIGVNTDDSSNPLYGLGYARFNQDGTLDTTYNETLKGVWNSNTTRQGWSGNGEKVATLQPLSDGTVIFQGGGLLYNTNGYSWSCGGLIDAEGNYVLDGFGTATWCSWINGILEEEDGIIIYGSGNQDIYDAFGGIDRGAGAFAKLKKVGRASLSFELPSNNAVLTNNGNDSVFNAYNTYYMSEGLDYSGLKSITRLQNPGNLRYFGDDKPHNLTGLVDLEEIAFYGVGTDRAIHKVPVLTGGTTYSLLTKVTLFDAAIESFTDAFDPSLVTHLTFSHDSWSGAAQSITETNLAGFSSLTYLYMNAPDLVSIPSVIGSPLLSYINIYNYDYNGGGSYVDVDLILSELVANGQTNGYFGIMKMSITSAGLADKQTLLDRGWTIYAWSENIV